MGWARAPLQLRRPRSHPKGNKQVLQGQQHARDPQRLVERLHHARDQQPEGCPWSEEGVASGMATATGTGHPQGSEAEDELGCDGIVRPDREASSWLPAILSQWPPAAPGGSLPASALSYLSSP